MSAAAHSVVEPSRTSKRVAGSIVVVYAVVSMIPLFWIFATSFKTPPDSIAYPPKVLFTPSIEGYCNLFTTRTRQTPEYINSLPPAATFCDETTRKRNMVIAGPSNFLPRFVNSLIIAFGSTFCAVFLGTLAAYGFSRFKVPLADDLLFFILSTRFMPPIAVAIPIYLMYRELGLSDTALGMILLYTAVNVSLAVWLLKGFIDEIPQGVRGSGDDRRLFAAAGVLEGRAAAGHDRHCRDRHLLPDLRLERICVCRTPDLGHGADRAALHPDDHRRGRAGLAGGGRRHHDLPRADPRLHHPASQAAAARHHLRGGAEMMIICKHPALTSPRRRAATRSMRCDTPSPLREGRGVGVSARGMQVARMTPSNANGRLRRGLLENIATGLIGLGFIMLFQPFALTLYTWSFVTMLFGTVMFIIVSKFPE